jgi:hypothetical protein
VNFSISLNIRIIVICSLTMSSVKTTKKLMTPAKSIVLMVDAFPYQRSISSMSATAKLRGILSIVVLIVQPVPRAQLDIAFFNA